MKAFCITIRDNAVSEAGFKECVRSSKRHDNQFEIERFDAVKDTEVSYKLDHAPWIWNWPWDTAFYDFATGLTKVPYKTNNKAAVVACFMSHYALWEKCYQLQEPILILEHDAMFIKHHVMPNVRPTDFVSINDPRGATRKSSVFYEKLKSGPKAFHDHKLTACPWVDDDRILPQGLPGGSAYWIGPEAALAIINYVKRFGGGPNDALICKQVFPDQLWCERAPSTKIQGLTSTTTR